MATVVEGQERVQATQRGRYEQRRITGIAN